MALYFCKKCGRIAQESYSQKQQICDCCNSIMHEVPTKYLDDDLDFMIKDKETEQLLIEELVKTSPEFDPYLFEHRDEILANKSAKYEAAMAYGKAILEGKDKGNKFGVECPYCHATNVKKITVASKAANTAVFGIFSMGRNSKNFHCNKCGSDF